MDTKIILKLAFALSVASSITACDANGIEGKWLEPVPGMEGQLQGINLEKGGKASSINMATLQYESWETKDNVLILNGRSIGNHETISFSDTLVIENLTKDELTLRKGELVINYTRE